MGRGRASESKKRKEMRRGVKHGEQPGKSEVTERRKRADHRGSGGQLSSRFGKFCLADPWRKKRIGKKAKGWRGRGEDEEEDGIGGRKKGGEGEETGGEKMYRGVKAG